MNLNQLIKTASEGYPDNLIEKIHAKNDGGDPLSIADGLAKFVVSEISETFDEKASDNKQLDTAMDVVDRAIRELTGVMSSLMDKRFC